MSRTDRDAVLRAYPRAAHDADAAENARPDAAVHYGVRIVLDPEKPGGFEVVRASRQVGEAASSQDALFIFPVRVAAAAPSRGYEEPAAPARPESSDGHETFVARIIEVAKGSDAPGPIGSGEERLKGFRGG